MNCTSLSLFSRLIQCVPNDNKRVYFLADHILYAHHFQQHIQLSYSSTSKLLSPTHSQQPCLVWLNDMLRLFIIVGDSVSDWCLNSPYTIYLISLRPCIWLSYAFPQWRPILPLTFPPPLIFLLDIHRQHHGWANLYVCTSEEGTS